MANTVIQNIFNHIEKNRNSQQRFWKFLVGAKDMLWGYYILAICIFSKTVLHHLWFFQQPQHYRIRPVILTCDKNLIPLRQFIDSYKKTVRGLQSPILCIDTFGKKPSKEYLGLLEQLDPYKIHLIKKVKKNRKDNIEHFLMHRIFALVDDDIQDAMLFLEDDIIFSSQFNNIIKRLALDQQTGFITLYSSFHEYFPTKTNGVLHTIKHHSFYGTQAIVFPKKSVQVMKKYSQKVERLPVWHDHKWAYLFNEMGYDILATNNSYVQHLDGKSRLRDDTSSYTSYKFIK